MLINREQRLVRRPRSIYPLLLYFPLHYSVHKVIKIVADSRAELFQ